MVDMTDENSMREYLQARNALNNLLAQKSCTGNRELSYYSWLKPTKTQSFFTPVHLQGKK